MATQNLYEHLQLRVQELERKFLADQLKAELEDFANYQPDADALAAFRLLVHAELEDYLERKARREIASMRNQLKLGQLKPCFSLYSLANHFGVCLPHETPFDQVAFTKSVESVLGKAEQALADNHGIKTSAFLTVCVICGKRVDEIDSSLGAYLKSYGEARGEVAHKSTARVSTIDGPSVQKSDAEQILTSISNFFYPKPPAPAALTAEKLRY